MLKLNNRVLIPNLAYPSCCMRHSHSQVQHNMYISFLIDISILLYLQVDWKLWMLVSLPHCTQALNSAQRNNDGGYVVEFLKNPEHENSLHITLLTTHMPLIGLWTVIDWMLLLTRLSWFITTTLDIHNGVTVNRLITVKLYSGSEQQKATVSA